MLKAVFGAGAVVTILAAAGVWLYSTRHAETAELAGRYDLNQPQVGLLRECGQTLRSKGKNFKDGMPVGEGCACLAKHVSGGFTPAEYPRMASAIGILFAQQPGDRSQLVRTGEIVAEQFRQKGIDRPAAAAMMGRIAISLNYCSRKYADGSLPKKG